MSWFRRLFSRSAPQSDIEKTFDEIEEEVSTQIAEDYAKKKDETLTDVFSELDDDTFAYLHQAKTNRLMRI